MPPIKSAALTSLLGLLPILGNTQTCLTASNAGISASTPTSQFITDLTNGTATDAKTGLMWKTCSEGQTWNSNTSTCDNAAATYTWQGALQQAQSVNSSGGFAGHADWRVPNIKQLNSIIEVQCYNPTINLSVFPSTPAAQYWSSSQIIITGGGVDFSWIANFNNGDETGDTRTHNANRMRLVRILPKRQLNDTGITACATNTATSLVCPQTTHPNQDAQSGRDVTHNNPSDGHAGFSFTKIGANGQPLAIQNVAWSATGTEPAGTQWSCVQDNVTGLWWEIKTDNGGLHDKDWHYSWYNSDNTQNGGVAGLQNGGYTLTPYPNQTQVPGCGNTSSCDTEAYVQAVNAQGWCGKNDWRLPTKAEFSTIATKDRISPAIDTAYFPTSIAGMHWTSSTYAFNVNLAWRFDLLNGWDDWVQKSAGEPTIMLVRDH